MMFKSKKQHIAEIYLDYTDVRFSRKYFSEALAKNPFPDTFAGIRQILLEFNIRSCGVALTYDAMLKIDDPFIAILPGLFDGFVVVIETSDTEIVLLTEKKEHTRISVDDFLAVWDGKILFPEITEESNEPSYVRNRTLTVVNQAKMPLTIILALILIVISFSKNMSEERILFSSIAIALYCIGSVVSGLLIMEGLNIYNPLTRKICNSGVKISCSKVLESKSSKLFGLIGWSEIGFIYFTGSLLFFILFPEYVNILFAVGLLALPYTIWSVVYQRFSINKWCPLCLTVQCLLWLQIVMFIAFRKPIGLSAIPASSIIAYILCMAVITMGVWWILPLISKAREGDYIKRVWLKIKSEENIFKSLLDESEKCSLPEPARRIILGNKSAENTVTVISNPYCAHCATFHTRLMRFLNLQDNFKAELIFIGEAHMEKLIKNLISAYLVYGSMESEKIYTEWFKDQGKKNRRYDFDSCVDGTDEIYQCSQKWYADKGTVGTPAIYINDRLLPDNYSLEDLYLYY